MQGHRDWWSGLRWRWRIVIIVVAIGVLGSVVDSREGDVETTLPAAPTGRATGQPTIPVAPPTATEAGESVSSFDASTVRVRITRKQAFGDQVEVYFVDDRAGVDHLALAKECVDQGARAGFESAFCFAFASNADFEHAHVDEVNGGMVRLCWSSRWGLPFSGSPDGTSENEFHELNGCPG